MALQVVVVAFLVLSGAVAAALVAQRDVRDAARTQVVSVARTLALSPQVREAVAAPRPELVLQPYAEQVRRATGTDFVVVMRPDRVRWSHPDPRLVGGRFQGTIAPALQGRTVTEVFRGSLGPSVRAVTPVRDAGGDVVALVAVGITTEALTGRLLGDLPLLLLATAVALLVGAGGAVLLTRRLRRQTLGLAPQELSRMYEQHDTVLHSVREGLVVVDLDGRLGLVNDEAARLLDLPADAVGTRVDDLPLPQRLRDLLAGETDPDPLHLVGDRVLVADSQPVVRDGRGLGRVTTLRDQTELQALTGRLDAVRTLTDALRASSHEAANRLHTVISLVELGRSEEALDLATAELALAQRLTDDLLEAGEEPALQALLLGKTAQAHERGVTLSVEVAPGTGPLPLPVRDQVTLVGNLVDNAVDAAAGAPPPRWVRVALGREDDDVVLEVDDSGPGPTDPDSAFSAGWSTKADPSGHGRGLGLALVGQVVRRAEGSVDVDGSVFTVRLPRPPGGPGSPADAAAVAVRVPP